MGAFDGNILTPTRPGGFSRDAMLPSLGALNPGAMVSPAALPGTTGTDCALVHGDRYEQVTGNVTEDFLKNQVTKVELNETHTTMGNLVTKVELNETHTTMGNLVARVNGTTNDTRVGVHNQTNIAPRNDLYMHTRSETHHQPEQREQKTEDFSIVKWLLEFKEKHFEWKWLFMEVKNISLGFCWPLSFEKHLLDAAGHIFALEGEPVKVEWSDITHSLGALATDIKAGKLKAAGAHLKSIAANINAGIAANADSPFG